VWVLPRLYAVLDVDLITARSRSPERVARDWLDAGIRLLQLRAKTLEGRSFLQLAERLTVLTREAGATFIVNDRADVAYLSGASGLHVGQTDLSPADARRVVGDSALVGLSTHNEAQIADALMQPIDYMAIGPVFGTTSKSTPDPVVGLAGIRAASAAAAPRGLPVVAIGGITIEVVGPILEAGATSVAVISALLDGEPAARATDFLRAVEGY
jgi:thiamine-phosphate pyrophosphorylase